MKQLTFVRHSIAQEYEEANDDFSRSLTPEGYERIAKTLPRIPKELASNALFLTSPAIRAFQTAQAFADFFKISDERIIKSDFLFSSFKEYSFFYFLEETVANENNVWVFGHNPMLSNLTEYLKGEDFYSFPKCGVVSFETSAKTWMGIIPDNSTFKLFINPK